MGVFLFVHPSRRWLHADVRNGVVKRLPGIAVGGRRVLWSVVVRRPTCSPLRLRCSMVGVLSSMCELSTDRLTAPARRSETRSEPRPAYRTNRPASRARRAAYRLRAAVASWEQQTGSGWGADRVLGVARPPQAVQNPIYACRAPWALMGRRFFSFSFLI